MSTPAPKPNPKCTPPMTVRLARKTLTVPKLGDPDCILALKLIKLAATLTSAREYMIDNGLWGRNREPIDLMSEYEMLDEIYEAKCRGFQAEDSE